MSIPEWAAAAGEVLIAFAIWWEIEENRRDNFLKEAAEIGKLRFEEYDRGRVAIIGRLTKVNRAAGSRDAMASGRPMMTGPFKSGKSLQQWGILCRKVNQKIINIGDAVGENDFF